MNVKILFFPLSITIALAMAVFYTKPEIDTVMTQRSVLAEKEQFAAEVSQKIQNAHDLETSLNADKEDETAVFRYLPKTRDDERILDGVNFLVSQSGLALDSVKIDKLASVDADAPVVSGEEAQGSAVIFANSGADTSAVSQAPMVVAKPKVLGVTVSAVGSYENIRDAVAKLSHMDRFQNFTNVSIDKSGTSSDVLNASFTVNFTYLPTVNAQGSFNHPALTQNTFDFGVVQKLKQYTTSAVPSVEVGASGASNPFLR